MRREEQNRRSTTTKAKGPLRVKRSRAISVIEEEEEAVVTSRGTPVFKSRRRANIVDEFLKRNEAQNLRAVSRKEYQLCASRTFSLVAH